MTREMAVGVCLVAVVLGACSAEDDALECGDEARNAIRDAVDQGWEDANECASDCDCTTVPIEVLCPGGTRLWLCSEPVHVDSVGDFERFMHDVEDDLCPRLGEGCFGGPGCLPRVGACLEGRCVAVDAPGDFDAGPGDAGVVDACVPGD